MLQPLQSNSQNSHKSGGQITLTQLANADGGNGQSASSAMQSMQQHMSQGVIVQNMGIGINGSGERMMRPFPGLTLVPPEGQT